MLNDFALDISFCFPELILAISSIVCIFFGLLGVNKLLRSFCLLILIATLLSIIFFNAELEFRTLFDGAYVFDSFTRYFKVVILIGCILILFVSFSYLDKEEGNVSFEYPILWLFAILGLFIMISSNNLIVLLIGLELQSIPLYVLMTIRKEYSVTNNVAFRYFVFGNLATVFILYGGSIIYGLLGTINFSEIAQKLKFLEDSSLMIYVAALLVILGVLFKIMIVPFHAWAIDICENVSIFVVIFINAIFPIAAFSFLIRLLMGPFSYLSCSILLVTLSSLSLIIGSLLALHQKYVKSFITCGSVFHMGYAMMGIALESQKGIEATMIYLFLYMFTIIAVFSCFMCLSKQGIIVKQIRHMSGIGRRIPFLGFALTTFMLSLAGIPPLSGFLVRFNVFVELVKSEFYLLFTIALLSSLIAIIYYLNIVRRIYLKKPKDGDFLLEGNINYNAILVICFGLLINFLFIFFPNSLFSLNNKILISFFNAIN